MPHLVTHRPDPDFPETLDRDYQQREVASDVEALIRRSTLSGLSYTIRPNGHTEGANHDWYPFHVEADRAQAVIHGASSPRRRIQKTLAQTGITS